MEYSRMEGLKVEDYIFPGEDNAFEALKKIPVLDQVVAACLKYLVQLQQLPQIQGDCYRVTEDTCPEIYAIYKKALGRLDMPEEYPLFVQSAFAYNAYTTGGDEPFVVIHSSVLKNFSAEELLYILGHELGHIKGGHLVYYTMAQQLGNIVANIPVAGNLIITAGIHYALMDWRRMQEFTADRAGVIACGSLETAIMALGRILGTGEKIPFVEFGIEDLKKQKDRFEEFNQDIVSKIICTMQLINSTHPWTVDRIKELERWQDSGGYGKFLDKYGGKRWD